MKLKGLASKILAGSMAFLMTFSGVQWSLPMVANAAEPTYLTSNYGIVDFTKGFGIIAFDNLYANAHTNTNFITSNFWGDKNCGTNTGTDKRSDNDHEMTYIGNLMQPNSLNEQPMAHEADYLYLGNTLRAIGKNNWGETYITNDTLTYANDPGNAHDYIDTTNYYVKKIQRPKRENIYVDNEYNAFINMPATQKMFDDYNIGLMKYSKLDATAEKDFTQTYRNINCGSGVTNINLTYDDVNPASDIVFRFNNLETNTTDICVVNMDCAKAPVVDGVKTLYLSSSFRVGNLNAVDSKNNAESNYGSTYNKVIFNFFDSDAADGQFTGRIVSNRESFGTIIAPKASVALNQNWDGVVVAKDVEVNAEYHRIGSNITPPIPTTPGGNSHKFDGSLSLLKTFDDKTIEEIAAMSAVDRDSFLNQFKFELYTKDENNNKVSIGTTEARWNHAEEVYYMENGEKHVVSPEVNNVIVSFTLPNAVDIVRGATKTFYIKETNTGANYLTTGTDFDKEFKIEVTNTTPADANFASFAVQHFDANDNPISGIATNLNKANQGPKVEAIKIKKVDVNNGNEIPDAHMALYELPEGSTTIADGSVVASWISSTNGSKEISGDLLKFNTTYAIHEEIAPSGYGVATDILFTIDSDGKITNVSTTAYSTDLDARVIVMADDLIQPGNMVISKKSIDGTYEVPGAELEIWTRTGETQVDKVESWTSIAVAHNITVVEGNNTVGDNTIAPGDYYLVENVAPTGYLVTTKIPFTVSKTAEGVVTVTSSVASVVSADKKTLTMRDAAIPDIYISKVEASGNNSVKELAGAKLALYEGVADSDNNFSSNPIRSWESGTEPYTIPGRLLKMNTTYTLRENNPPAGYEVATDITFKIDENGKVTNISSSAYSTSSAANRTIVMFDGTTTSISISKKAINGTSELKDAVLKVVNAADDTEVLSWTSTTTPKNITIGTENDAQNFVLKPGEYKLVEITAPKGYAVAESIPFKINTDGSLSSTKAGAVSGKVLTMKDNPIDAVKISKKAVSGQSELKDAKLAVYSGRETDNTLDTTKAIDSWTTGTTSHEIAGSNFEVGKYYTLRETYAPAGYKICETDIVFTIKENGKPELVGTYDNLTVASLANGVITMFDALESTIGISKYDVNNSKELPGAKLKIATDEAGTNVVYSWTSTSDQQIVKIDDTTGDNNTTDNVIKSGTYYLIEETAPNGYTVAEKINFTVSAEGKITLVGANASAELLDNNSVLRMKDKQIEDIVISKQAVGGGAEVVGAKLELYVGSGSTKTKLTDWTCTATPKTIKGTDLVAGQTYTLHETYAPAGYKICETDIVFKVNENGTIEQIDATGNIDGRQVTMFDDVEKSISISKVDINTSKALPNATLSINEGANDTVGTEIMSWSTGTEPQKIKIETDTVASEFKLAPGTYYLVEKGAPDGYAITTSIKFTVDGDGKITSDTANVVDSTGKILTMADAPIKNIKLSKKAVSGSNELAGATLELYKGSVADGNRIGESWISGDKPHEISGSKLVVGETYILHEVVAPSTYLAQTDISFKIKNDGTVELLGSPSSSVASLDSTATIVTMFDALAPVVEFSKQDVNGNGKTELKDAKLQIAKVNADGSVGAVVEEWTSKTSTKKITVDPTKGATVNKTDGIIAPGTYYMVETTAPNGYLVAEKIKFTVSEEGVISGNTGGLILGNNKTLRMLDKPIDDIYISKVEVTNGTVSELADAKIELYEGEGTTGTLVEKWTSSDTIHKVSGRSLKLNTTYTIHEDAAPAGFKVASDIKFTIDGNGKITYISAEAYSTSSNTGRKIVMLDKEIPTADATISKVETNAGSEIPGAELTVATTDTTIDLSNLTVTLGTDATLVEKTTDKITFISGTTDTIIKKLPQGTYTLTEVTAPAGYAVAETVTFKVTADGKIVDVDGNEITKVTMEDAPIVVKMSKKELSKTEELPGATLELTTTSDVDLTKVVVSGGATGVDKQTKTITWKSGTSETIFTKLPAGDYSYVEKATPDNSKYEVATTITFTVGKDGKITNLKNAASTSSTDNNLVVMEDALKVKTVTFSKREVSKTDELAGATLKLETKTTGVDLSKLTVTGGSEVAKTASAITWKTAATAVTVEKLPTGSYTLTETAAPNGFAIATVITFDVDANGTVTNVKNAARATDLTNPLHAYIVMEDSPVGTFQFSKENLGGHLIKGAKLQVVPVDGQDLSTVTVLGTSGYTADEVTITKDSITWVSKYKPLGLVAVPDGKYKLIEVDVPVGYAKAEPLIFEAKDGILTKGGANGAVELTDLYDPTTTTVSVYSRYYNVETFDPKHEDIIESDTPTADNTQFTLFDENGKEAKIVKKIVKREEIDDGVWVTIVTFVIDTTEWTPGTNRTYTIKETIAPTAKENGGYFADDEQMVTTYTIMKKVGSDGNTTYDRTWSNKYGKNVVYNEFDPKYIPLYSHTKTKGASTNKTPETPVPTPPSTETSTSKKRSPKTGETAIPFVLFGGAMSALVAGAVWYTINLKKREEE